MIQLYQYHPTQDLSSPSPFCVKVEAYLRMAKLKYQAKVGDPRKGPTQKLPCIRHNGKFIGDSSAIIQYLKQEFGDPLDAELTGEQKYLGHSLQVMLEEHLYWGMVHARWVEDSNWKIVKESFFKNLPAPAKWFVPNAVRKNIKKQLWGQGLGRHTKEKLYELTSPDLDALSHFIGEKPFLFGGEPSSYDAVVYGFLSNLLVPPIPSPLQDHAAAFQNLVEYQKRTQEIYFPELSGGG